MIPDSLKEKIKEEREKLIELIQKADQKRIVVNGNHITAWVLLDPSKYEFSDMYRIVNYFLQKTGEKITGSVNIKLMPDNKHRISFHGNSKLKLNATIQLFYGF